MPILVENDGSTNGREYRLDNDLHVLGRQGDADLRGIFAADSRVSRNHARIVQEHNAYFLEDLGSRNGTQVNGKTILVKTPLADGDCIRICGIELRFHLETPVASAGSAGLFPDAAKYTQFIPGSAESSILARADASLSTRSYIGQTPADQRKLDALLEMLRNLGAVLDMDVVLQSFLDGLFRLFPNADRAFVGLKDEHTGAVTPRCYRYRQMASSKPMTISDTIVTQVMSSGQAILCSDVAADDRFCGSQSILETAVRSFMCAPLTDTEDNVWGMIQLEAMPAASTFSETDLQVLASVAPQAGIAVKYAQIHAREIQQQSLIRDLEVARRVQHTLLPATAPAIAGYEFFAHYESAREVGGDYYTYECLPDGRLAVVVADVAGKGVSAALLMAKMSGELQAYLSSEASPSAAVCRMNRSLTNNGRDLRFVTLVLVVVDPVTHELEVVNAGHVLPLLRRANGTVEPLGDETCGIPLGLDASFDYESCRYPIQSGEAVLLVTDGVTEAGRVDNELYGLGRLEKQFAEAAISAQQIVQGVLGDIAAFVDGASQRDDTCVICIRRAN